MRNQIWEYIKQNANVFSGISVCAVFFFIVFWAYYQESKLKNELVVVSGRITDIKELSGLYGGGDANVHYSFTVNNIKYNGKHSSNPLIYLNRDTLIWKYFPVVYQKRNPENCSLLISPRDFRKYGIKYPDSLEWLKTKCFPPESRYR